MKKKKKEIIGMGNPTRNMELFNQALGTGNVTGTLAENFDEVYRKIIKSKLSQLLNDLNLQTSMYDITIYNTVLKLSIEMIGTIKYGFLTTSWKVFSPFWIGKDPIVEGNGFNNLVDEIISGFNIDSVKISAKDYYLKAYFAKSDSNQLETDSKDELLSWCENIFETDMSDKIQVINTNNFKEMYLYKNDFI